MVVDDELRLVPSTSAILAGMKDYESYDMVLCWENFFGRRRGQSLSAFFFLYVRFSVVHSSLRRKRVLFGSMSMVSLWLKETQDTTTN